MMDHPAMCPGPSDLDDVLEKTTDPNDAWGKPYAIECSEETVHVSSSGPDGQADTEDDVGI